MMASADEGVGALLRGARGEKIDDTVILFLGDNGFFFGEHALAPSAASPTRKTRTAFFMCVIRASQSRAA